MANDLEPRAEIENPLLVGIDVGGTTIKCGVFTMDGEELNSGSVPTEIDTPGLLIAIATRVGNLVESIGADLSQVIGVGLAVPGVVDSHGKLLMTPNITLDLEGFINALSVVFRQSIVVPLNDANAAALGEMWLGAGGEAENLVLLTLGTGVGAGVVIDCHVLAGIHGGAGECGHICVNPDEKLTCGCGNRGCLEQYASASGIVRLYKEACEAAGQKPVKIAHATDSLAVFDAFEAGDPCAKQALDTAMDYLARALASIACVVDPEAFVIGGGVSGGFELFEPILTERYKHYAIPAEAQTPIVCAELGNRAGRVGAAFQARLAAGR